MDPVALGLGGESVQRRMSQYLVLTLASVLAPGVVLVVAAGALIVRARHGRDAWQVIVDTSGDVHGALTALLAVALVAAAYVVGYVARELAFTLLGLIQLLRPELLLTARELHRQLRATFGDAAVSACLRTHPLLDHLLHAEREPPAVKWRGGGAMPISNGTEAFLYAKAWLSHTAPNLAPNDIETEINVLLSLFFPVGLGGWTFLAFGQPGPAATALTLGLAAGLWWLLLVSVIRLRRAERWESLRGLVGAHAMERSIARPQAPSADVPQPSPVPRPDGDGAVA